MSEDWKEVTIGEITTSCLGKMLDKQKNKGEYQPYLANVNVRWGGFDLSNLSQMRFEESEQERYGLKYGDIVLCEGGEPGRCAIWKNQRPNMKIQKALHRIRVNEGINNEYLYYWFLWAGKRGLLNSYFTGTTIQHLPGDKLKSIRLHIPSYEQQERIASILSCLDAKIELNNQINENLQQQAQAIFKAWFVDFEPFGGVMPENWRIGTISDLGNVAGGSTPSKAKPEYYTEKGIAWITPKDLSRDHSMFIYHGEIDITEEGLKNSSASIMPRGTVLFSSRAPIGYIAIAGGEVTTNQGFKSVVPFDHIGTAYVYYCLKHNLPTIEGMASGSTFKEVSGAVMKSVPVIVPDEESLSKFSDICKPLFEEQEGLERQNRRLSETRNELLVKLMTL